LEHAVTISIQLDATSGVPFYRQIIDRVRAAVATGELSSGDRLPTVRQLAVDLSINPNTVSRAYTELELTGLVETQMGSGTFVGSRPIAPDDVERRRLLDRMCQEFLSRASAHGFTLDDVLDILGPRRRR
jgi:GntR family transcriptional regulator